MRRKKWNKSEHIEKWIPLTSGKWIPLTSGKWIPLTSGPRCLFTKDYLSQTTSSKYLKNSFSRRIGSLVGHTSYHYGKETQLHFQKENCQKIEF